VLFRYRFTLNARPRQATLWLFAHTRYRLLINGVLIGHGPARGFPGFEYADQHKVGAALQYGDNVIALMVCSAGERTFHSHDERGGLAAWLTLHEADGSTRSLVTDGRWKAMASSAHQRGMPNLSFALNAAEWCDLRELPSDWAEISFEDKQWPAAVPLDEPAFDPAKLRPRPIPMLDESDTPAARRVGTWSVFEPTQTQTFRIGVEHDARRSTAGGRLLFVKFALHAESAGTYDLQFTRWSRLWVDGQEVPTNQEVGPTSVALQQGWQTCVAFTEVERSLGQYFVTLPTEAGLTLRAEPTFDCPDRFSHSPVMGGPRIAKALQIELPQGLAQWDEATLGPWHRQALDKPFHAPAVDHEARLLEPVPVNQHTAEASADGVAWLYDFGGELLGRPRIELTAPAGTVVDLTYSEQRYADGRIQAHARENVSMVERLVTRKGRQTFHVFHPRGCRYLELQVMGDHDAVTIHRIDATRAVYPTPYLGSFACSDQKLTRIWELGLNALRACMEDAYLDCPWRERGVYVGDLLVEYLANLPAIGDHALMRRSIEIFLQGQGPQGWIRGGAYVLEPGRYPDYTLLLPQCAEAYVRHSGDQSLLRDYADRWALLADGIQEWLLPDGDLIDGKQHEPYIDLSQHGNREPVSLVLNLLFVAALEQTADLLDSAGMTHPHAAQWREQAAKTRTALGEKFYDGAQRCFTDRQIEDDPQRRASVHGNVMALRHGLAKPDQIGGVLDYLRQVLPDNMLGNDHPADRTHCRVNAYFSHYLLEELVKYDEQDLALAFIRDNFGRMVDGGAWSSWEYFVDSPGASRCHAWSAAPTWFLSQQVLGVTIAGPDRGHAVTVEPRPLGLTWARGRVPHPAGMIELGWEQPDADRPVRVWIDAPEGVAIEVHNAERVSRN
jgi:hypothetical protein